MVIGLVYGLMVTALRLGKSAVDAVSKRCNRVEAPQHYDYTVEALRERFKGKIRQPAVFLVEAMSGKFHSLTDGLGAASTIPAGRSNAVSGAGKKPFTAHWNVRLRAFLRS